MDAFPDAALCPFLVGFTAQQRISQRAGKQSFVERPEVFGLKVRDQDKE